MELSARHEEILRYVARHDRELGWYRLDRTISNGSSGIVGPFFVETQELIAAGLIEGRPHPDITGECQYCLTENGRRVVESLGAA